MQHNYAILTQLIDELAIYEEQYGAAATDFSSFVNHLVTKQQPVAQKRVVTGTLEKEVQRGGDRMETSIATQVTYIHRYAKLYGRKALTGTPLQSLDDFTYLVILFTHESLTKTELIHKNVHEKTTGMEIIKRLIRAGLVTQHQDDADKRSQRIKVTEAGRGVLLSLLPKLNDISTIITSTLTATEKVVLHNLLVKLDHYHFDIYMHQKEKSLEELAALVPQEIASQPSRS
jgi:MarR family transcriptional regulator, lower aerobic nicotinate degradation pathway regulator